MGEISSPEEQKKTSKNSIQKSKAVSQQPNLEKGCNHG